jgi:hypothetical protein
MQVLQLKTPLQFVSQTQLPEAWNTQVKNYKHKQILLTPININRSEPWSTKGNTACEPHLESNLADHIVSTPNLWWARRWGRMTRTSSFSVIWEDSSREGLRWTRAMSIRRGIGGGGCGSVVRQLEAAEAAEIGRSKQSAVWGDWEWEAHTWEKSGREEIRDSMVLCVGFWRLGREEEPAGRGAHSAAADGGAHSATREHEEGECGFGDWLEICNAKNRI